MTKPELRDVVRGRLRGLPAAELADKSAAICRTVAGCDEWKAARTVGLFSPLASEPDVNLLWALQESRSVCYPRVHGDHIVFIRVPNRSALLESRWKLLEPLHAEENVVALNTIDLLLVPGLAFTRDGHRLGRGGGFYDRLLVDRSPNTVALGICFEEQIVPKLPMETHDQIVDRVIFA